MRISRKINYFTLIIAFVILWGSIYFLYISIQIYSLRNSYIVDTSTALQSLESFFSSKPFINTVPGGSYFSVHASEFLYILLQVITLKFSALSLYAVQIIITFGAAIPLFLIGRNHLKDDRSAFLIAMAYLFFPYIEVNPFELLTLFMGLIIFSFYFLETRHFIAFIITFLLALSTMEFAPLLGFSIGLYFLLIYFLRTKTNSSNKKNPILIFGYKVRNFIFSMKTNHGAQLGIFIALISIAFYIIDSHIILLFSDGTHIITSNLAGAGGDLLPTLSSKIESFFQLNAPFALMSFFDPIWLLELPWAVASGFSTFGPYWSTGVYYDSYIIPFVAISAIFGIRRISSFFGDRSSRIKLVRYLSALILVVSVVSVISITVVPMAQNIQPSSTAKGIDVSQLAELIPNGAGVYTGSNEMPIVSSHTWNTWIYGGPQKYTLFNAYDGPPYNVSGMGFEAASGSYLLYSENYTGLPVFNDFQANTSIAGGSLGPLSVSSSLFLPPGNYSVNASFIYKPAHILKEEIGQGNVSSYFMAEKYVVIQPFTVSTPINISSIVVPATMYPGYYILQSEITAGNDLKKVVAQDSIGRNQYNTPYLSFSFSGQELFPNVTYYFWLWSSGDPGGLYLPLTSNSTSENASMAVIYSGSGTDSYGYYFNSYSNLTTLNKSLEFTIVGSSPDHAGSVIPTNISLNLGGAQRNISLSGNSYISLVVNRNDSSDFVISADSSFLNGTLNGISVTITSTHMSNQKESHGIALIPWLIIIFIIFAALLILSFTDFAIPSSKKVARISRLVMALSFVIINSLYAYYYYSGTFNLIVLRIMVSIEFISLFLFFVFGDILRISDRKELFPISEFDDL